MRREPIDIDPDIRKARTLPGWFYRSEQVHAWLERRLLARSWQLITHLSRIAPFDEDSVQPAAWPFRFLPGSIDEPLLLTRDEQGMVHCLSNVCTHRAATLVSEPCKAAELRCPYHGRCFALDGRMRSMPEFDDALEFPSPSDDLPQLPLVGFGNFLFTAIDPAWPFAELVELLTELAGHLPWADAALEPAGTAVYELDANWLLYCDNYLEGFHAPHVHPGLAGAVDFDRYETRVGSWSSVRIAFPAAPGAPTVPAPEDAPANYRAPAALYFFLFPNTMFNVYPWGISLNVVEPIAVDRTRIRYEAWVWAPELYDTGAGSRLAVIEREDEDIVRRVQQGIRSGLYDRGRYSPGREQGVHHFHRLLARGWNRQFERHE
jgi:choline monooxygenase